MGDDLNRFSLTNRVAVVTGASEGIGEAIALGLAGAGADVIVCSRREEKLKGVKAEIEKRGRRPLARCSSKTPKKKTTKAKAARILAGPGMRPNPLRQLI